ncbi:MAG TPA: 3-dehydroquinate synthase [Pyrinomonadaceae bacterium]|nr:3-dehydroquinate synthase [Pyrinomonadaceae bacterium]
MKQMRHVRVRLAARENYEIEIGANALDVLGDIARRSLSPHARRIAVVSNERVFKLYGAAVVRNLRAAGFNVSHWLMGDGEHHKNLRTAARALAFFSESKLERTDAVVALGGGVVGDLAGFAAAVYLRGIAFLQAPTTLLAQIDASVGGKTAVNTRDGKNLVGAFHQPRAVVISTETLLTLPQRELTAGWCEAIKQGAVGSRRLFEQTRRFLAAERMSESARNLKPAQRRADELAGLIAAQCAFKAGIVADDEREDIGRTDARSRRILNFGHTTAHALEAVTRYRRFRHGEAVGYGMLVAAEISARLGMLDASELESLRACVRLAGRLPRADDLDERAILRAIASDKKSVGGHVRWVLLERLGRARIVGGEEIPPRVVRAALRAALAGSLGDKSEGN